MGYTPPYLDVRKIGTHTDIYGIGVTGDYLRLYANQVDGNCRLEMYGGAGFYLVVPNGEKVTFKDNTGAEFLDINWVTPDAQLSTRTNYNLALLPQGTGKVKFGSYVPGAKTDSTGYIEILDSGGTSRRLMVQSV
jgi:hypothetical protein